MVFEVSVPGLENKIACAGRNFVQDLNHGSDLRNFLEMWLGDDFFKDHSNQEFDMETLIGRQAELVLTHFQSDKYDKPHVNIAAAQPKNDEAVSGKD